MLNKETQERLVMIAIEEAEAAITRGDDPFGGLIVDQRGSIIVRNGNRENTEQNPGAHAEMVLLREAAKKLRSNDLSDYISICNAESCPMCMSAMVMAGIKEFYFGTWMENRCNPYIRMRDVASASNGEIIIVDGILEEKCREVMVRGRRIRGFV
jgi:tRNA(adenine34) deaminase